MDQGLAILMLREAILLIIKLSMPILLVALAVGVIISLLQALTQIQEQTLTFVPKMLAVFGVLLLLLPFMLGSLQDFAGDIFNLIMIKEASVAL
ncbi:MAG: flagellar biosynthesis protein FliQ [Proteobacteria bacterium]|nr:flagellar biosynthesis protein FliQ [Pseudomonadota bacterium]